MLRTALHKPWAQCGEGVPVSFSRFNVNFTCARRTAKISGPKESKFRSNYLQITKVITYQGASLPARVIKGTWSIFQVIQTKEGVSGMADPSAFLLKFCT